MLPFERATCLNVNSTRNTFLLQLPSEIVPDELPPVELPDIQKAVQQSVPSQPTTAEYLGSSIYSSQVLRPPIITETSESFTGLSKMQLQSSGSEWNPNADYSRLSYGCQFQTVQPNFLMDTSGHSYIQQPQSQSLISHSDVADKYPVPYDLQTTHGLQSVLVKDPYGFQLSYNLQPQSQGPLSNVTSNSSMSSYGLHSSGMSGSLQPPPNPIMGISTSSCSSVQTKPQDFGAQANVNRSSSSSRSTKVSHNAQHPPSFLTGGSVALQTTSRSSGLLSNYASLPPLNQMQPKTQLKNTCRPPAPNVPAFKTPRKPKTTNLKPLQRTAVRKPADRNAHPGEVEVLELSTSLTTVTALSNTSKAAKKSTSQFR